MNASPRAQFGEAIAKRLTKPQLPGTAKRAAARGPQRPTLISYTGLRTRSTISSNTAPALNATQLKTTL